MEKEVDKYKRKKETNFIDSFGYDPSSAAARLQRFGTPVTGS